jgi:Fe2+ or Zn2+ uptake regulation protein
MTVSSPVQRQAWAIRHLQSKRVRLSRPRLVILWALAAQEEPVSLDVLSGELKEACNLTTLYRTMHAFQKAEVVRQVNLTRRYASFVLNTPGQHHEFLVCNGCGLVNDLPDAQPIVEFEKQLVARFGFTALHREVKFYGKCPNCQHSKP